jgi:hypothetical protein
MKVSGINAAMAHKIEMQKLVHQETIKQQQIKVIKDRQEELQTSLKPFFDEISSKLHTSRRAGPRRFSESRAGHSPLCFGGKIFRLD